MAQALTVCSMLQVGLTVAGGGQDATLGGAPFHAQALTALGLSGAGADLQIAFGGDPPVDSRLLVRQRVCCRPRRT